MTVIPCRFLATSLRPTLIGAPHGADAAGLGDRLIENGRRLLHRLDPLAFARYLAAFLFGILVTAAWQQSLFSPTGPAAASAAASPDQQQLNAILLDTTRRNVDRIAASITAIEEDFALRVKQLGAGQDQLAAGQDQMTREIARLQAALSKTAESSPRPAAPAPASSAPSATPQRPAHGSVEADARSSWRRQPCCQWPASSQR